MVQSSIISVLRSSLRGPVKFPEEVICNTDCRELGLQVDPLRPTKRYWCQTELAISVFIFNLQCCDSKSKISASRFVGLQIACLSPTRLPHCHA